MLIAAYCRHKRLDWPSHATRDVRANQLKQISLKIPRMVSATEAELGAWRDDLEGAVETVCAYLSCCRGFYEWLSLDAKVRPDNPAARLRRPKRVIPEPRPILARNYTLALASAAVTSIEMYLWLLLLGCCGMRCCEVAWMLTTDIERREDGSGLAHIMGKGGKRRTVPIGSGVMATLHPFLGSRGPVFTRSSDGRAHSPKAVSHYTNLFLHELGITETAHQLRHRFGTDYHTVDVDIFRQAKIMGHASVETTQRYTALTPTDAARHVETLTRRWMPLDAA